MELKIYLVVALIGAILAITTARDMARQPTRRGRLKALSGI